MFGLHVKVDEIAVFGKEPLGIEIILHTITTKVLMAPNCKLPRLINYSNVFVAEVVVIQIHLTVIHRLQRNNFLRYVS